MKWHKLQTRMLSKKRWDSQRKKHRFLPKNIFYKKKIKLKAKLSSRVWLLCNVIKMASLWLVYGEPWQIFCWPIKSTWKLKPKWCNISIIKRSRKQWHIFKAHVLCTSRSIAAVCMAIYVFQCSLLFNGRVIVPKNNFAYYCIGSKLKVTILFYFPRRN